MNYRYELFSGNNLSTRASRAIHSFFSCLLVSFLLISTLNLSGISSLFNVAKAQSDASIVSLSINSPQPLHSGTELSYQLTLSEPIMDVTGVNIFYWINDQGLMFERSLYFNTTVEGNTIELRTNLPVFNANGDWSINSIIINTVNQSYVFNFQAEPVNTNDFGFLTGNFTISDSLYDTQPPQLVSVGFSHDYVGPNTNVTISVSAFDDVAGISYGYLELVKPNGQRTGLGLTPSDDIFQTNFYVDQFELEGDYKIARIVLNDNAGNSIEYANPEFYDEHANPFSFSGVGFTVEGTSPIPLDVVVEEVQLESGEYVADHSYPVIVRVSPIDQNYMFANAYFQTPDNKDRIVSLTYQGNGIFVGDISVKSYDMPGEYKLKYLYFNVNQYAKFSHNYDLYPNESVTFDVLVDSFDIVGTVADITPPVIEMVSIQKSEMFAGQANILNITVSDDHSLTQSVLVRYQDNNGQNHDFWLWPKNENEFETHIYIDSSYAMTDWKIVFVELSDHAGNRAAYVSEEVDNPDQLPILDFTSGNFSVLGEAPRPEISLINNYQPIIGLNDYYHVEITFYNLDDPNTEVALNYQSIHQDLSIYGHYIGDNTYSFSFYDLPWYPNGSYQLQTISINTGSNYYVIASSNVFPEPPFTYDLAPADFYLLGGMEVADLPIIDSLSITPYGEPGDIISFDLIFSEVFANIDQIQLNFYNQYGQQFFVELSRNDTLTYSGFYYVHDYSHQGVYQLSSMMIYYFNSLPHQFSPESGFPEQSFEIAGTLIDSEPPVFISIESVTKRVTKNETGIIHLRAKDFQSGIQSVSADILCNQNWLGISFTRSEDDLFVGEFDVRSYTPEGLCKIYSLNIFDFADNVRQVRNIEYDANGVDLSASDFEVYDTTSSSYALNYVDTVQSTKSIVGSGHLDMTMYFDEPYIDSYDVEAIFVNEFGREKVLRFYRIDEGVYRAFEYFSIYSAPGTYKLDRIITHYEWMEITIYHDDQPSGYPYFDFSDVYFEVVGTIEDTTPPQLLGSTINRTSATINQKIELVINAIDLETEIEYARIEVEHKTSGFTFQMYFSPFMSGHLNAFFYVSSYMPEGNYRVRLIYLSDVAHNNARYHNFRSDIGGEYSLNLDHLDFAVYNTLKDYSKPVLNSLVFLDENVSPNGTVTMLIEANDEGSGLSHSILTMKHKTSSYEFDMYMWMTTRGLTATYGYIYDDAFFGDYIVKKMQIEDKTGNVAVYCNSQVTSACNIIGAIPFNFDNNQLKITPKGEPQYLELFDSVYVSRNNLVDGDTVTIRVTLKEEYRWANMLFVHYDSYEGFAYLYPEFVSKGAGVFEATQTIDEYIRWNHEYKAQNVQLSSGLRYFYVFDDGWMDYYSDLEYIADLSQFNINVSQSFIDTTPPELNGIHFSKTQYRHNDYMRLNVDAIDPESRIEGIVFNFRLDGKVMRTNTFLNSQFLPFDEGKLVYNEFFVSAGMKPGLYEIDYIQINNSFGLKTTVYNEKFYGQRSDARDFEGSKFEIISEDYDYVKPEFVSAQINKRTFASGDRITITIEATDVGSGLRTGYLGIKNRQASFKDNHLIEQNYSVELRKISDRLLIAEFEVDPYFAPGIFDITEISIYDESFNGTRIKNSYFGIDSGSYDFSNLSFEVTGTQLDQDLPELVSLEMLTPVVALGDTISVKVNAFDLKSGVNYIDVVWECGSFGQIVAHGVAPKNPDEPIILTGYVRSSLKACEYKVKFVYLSDRAGNWRYYTSGDVNLPQSGILNFSQASIQVFGQTESVVVNDVQVSSSQPQPLDVIEVAVDIHDNIVKPESASIKYRSSFQTERTVTLSLGGDMDYRGWIEIGEFEASAVWDIDSITFIDRYGEEYTVFNSVFYPNEVNVSDMSSASFVVDNPLGDTQAPEYNGSQLEKGEETTGSLYSRRLVSLSPTTQSLTSTTGSELLFRPNDLVSFTIDATDDVSGVDKLEITYDVLGKLITFEVSLTSQNDKYVGSARIMSYHPEGLWLVHRFVLIDKAGNRYEKKRSASEMANLRGFAHLQLSVVETQEDKDAPTVSDMTISNSSVQVGDVVEIIGSALDINGVKNFEVVLRAKTYGVERVIVMNRLDDGRYLGTVEITENILGDVWQVNEIIVEDYAGNRGVITQQTQDLSSLNFTVKAISEIVIEKLPEQLVYDLNDSFSLQGLILVAKYNDGSSAIIDSAQLLVHGFDSTTEKLSLDVYLQYKNKITKLTVKVMDVAMVALEITASPDKLTYTQGESLDLSGLIVWGYYNSGKTERIDLTIDHVVNPEVTSSAPGTYQVFMQYEGFEVFYYIEVVAPVEENKTPVTIIKTDTMMVITTPVGKVKVIMFNKKSSTNLDNE
jgi:hypothetical protein